MVSKMFRVFNVPRVTVLVKQGISRCEKINKHYPVSVDNSCMLKEIQTGGLWIKFGFGAFCLIFICSSYTWAQIISRGDTKRKRGSTERGRWAWLGWGGWAGWGGEVGIGEWRMGGV